MQNNKLNIFLIRCGLILMFLTSLFVAGGCRKDEISIDTVSGSGQEDLKRESSKQESSGSEVSSMENHSFESSEATSTDSSIGDEFSEVYVYICGAVVNEGVYELPSDSRIQDALELAGGYSEDAYRGYVNLAAGLTDGERIYFPTIQEVNDGKIFLESGGDSSSDNVGGLNGSGDDQKININTAGRDELMTLSGIGESKADDIIAYREVSGGFSSIEDIKNVSGIGDATFNRLKDKIYVR